MRYHPPLKIANEDTKEYAGLWYQEFGEMLTEVQVRAEDQADPETWEQRQD